MAAVHLASPSAHWPEAFASLAGALAPVFAGTDARIEHIGSTAVPGLVAKPVLDVLVGVPALGVAEARREALEALGFRYRPEYEDVLPQRRYFTRDPGPGLRVHLHAVETDSPLWAGHLAFRDALRSDDALRDEYAALKQSLAVRFAHDKAAYTDAKAPFIARVLAAHRGQG